MKNVYLLIGTQKAGTTSIYMIFKHDPNVNCANIKETKFFLRDESYNRGIEFYKKKYFSPEKESLPYLDVDPEYIFYDFIPNRIYDSLGKDVNFIVILRDPTERAYSQYLMAKARGFEDLSFEEALKEEPLRMQNMQGQYYNAYIQRGFYFKQLQQYLQFFPLEKFKIFLFEDDFKMNKSQMIREICDFIQIPYPKTDIHIKTNSSLKIKSKWADQMYKASQSTTQKTLQPLIQKLPSNYQKKANYYYNLLGGKLKQMYIDINTTQKIEPLSQAVRQHLIQKYFLEDINQLEKLINRDLSNWKK